jgi:GNAT superfamily N-acetyltransferase
MPSCRPSWSGSPPTGSAALPELRPAAPGDVPSLLDVFFRAMEDLDERRRRPPQPRNPGPLEMHFQHLLGTDPRSAIVADDHGRVVAFGIVMRRDANAFLSFLFVLPQWQARGLGRAIIGECLRGAGEPVGLSTCAEADQLVSTGLYASLGLAPREPIYLLRGDIGAAALPALPDSVRARPVVAEEVDPVDDHVLGYRRPQDHAFWSGGGRRGWMFETVGGRMIGYGYAHPSGRIGPVAALDPADLPALVGHLVRGTAVLEGRQVVVGGAAISALGPLLAGGMRMDGTPAIYCAQRPGPRFDRYIPMSFALL